MAKRIFDIAREFGLHPKVILAKAKELGIAQAKVVSSLLDDQDTTRLEEELHKAKLRQMKPCLKNRKLVGVWATLTWNASMKYRVYSCPDTPEFEFVSGATALVLKNKQSGAHIPLGVCSVTKLAANELDNLNGIEQPFRERLRMYLAEVRDNETIIHPGSAHRFYFLSTELWPTKMEELTASASLTEWSAILSICAAPEQFFEWPQVGTLLWPDCVRTQNDGEHVYPEKIMLYLARLGLKPDTRTNGPAIVSFLAAGGKRPNWGNEGWHIHHIFDGTEDSRHAVHDGNLFTHSAGLVAAHPVAHYLAHQSALLKWLLRREAFLRFGFDPNQVFGNSQ
jgi:hypothetical protein